MSEHVWYRPIGSGDYEIWVRDNSKSDFQLHTGNMVRSSVVGAALQLEESYGTGNVQIRKDGKVMDLL